MGYIKKNLIIIFIISLTSCVEMYDEAIAKEVDKLEIQVANDAIKSYEIAMRNKSYMDAYIQTGIISISFLNANDEENYKKWKILEKQVAKKIGM